MCNNAIVLYVKIMFMLWLIFFFFNSCFAEEEAFFKEIDKKPNEVQEKTLKHRLQFISRRRMDLKIEDTINTYLRVKIDNDEEKIDFIISLLNRTSDRKEVDIERKILSSAIRFCRSRRGQCIFLLKSLPKIKNSEILDKDIRAEMLNEYLLHFRNYSPEIAKSSFLTEIFDKLISDNKENIKEIFSLAYKYGLNQYILKKIEEHKKELGNEGWFKYRECFLFLVKNQYEKTKTCFEKNQEKWGWHKFGYLYSDFLQGKEIKNENLERFGIMLGENQKSWFIIFKIFLLRNGTKEMFSSLDMDKIVKNYVLGFYFFSINSHHRMFKGKELEELMEKYNKKFKSSLFQKILKNEVSGEKLAEYFGKNSIFYQFYKKVH